MKKECEHSWKPTGTGYFEASDGKNCFYIVTIYCRGCEGSETHVVPCVGEGEIEEASKA